jgi:pimeloyl-ACP methyl ester carboxylesterase
MWRPIIPLLAEKFTVIAPDLSGIGDSSIPTDKIDMLSAANRIHALVRSLGVEKARVIGHDIGLMVAYAYAAQFPAETEKLVVMDAFLPGVEGWEPIYNDPHVWHFRFNGEYPEKLVKGRERTYFEYFWNVLAADKTRWIPEADRKAYTEAYSKPGRMRAAWAYFASWPQLAKDFAQLSQTKLNMPVLSIGGDKSLGNELAAQMKLVATVVTVVVLKDTGHWILEERPKRNDRRACEIPLKLSVGRPQRHRRPNGFWMPDLIPDRLGRDRNHGGRNRVNPDLSRWGCSAGNRCPENPNPISNSAHDRWRGPRSDPRSPCDSPRTETGL